MTLKEATVGNGNECKTRRQFFRAAVVAAGAGVAAHLASPDRAAADDLDNLVLGAYNTASAETFLLANPPTSSAFTVFNSRAGGFGVRGTALGTDGVGIRGDANVNGGIGVVGAAASTGGHFYGAHAAIRLEPQAAAGAPTGASQIGEMLVDSEGALWLCVVTGTPGVWRQISPGGAGTRYLSAPQRAYDSRTGADGKLRAGFGDTANPRVIPITAAVADVPADAIGVVGNLALTEQDAGGFATVWPGGVWPGTANINFMAHVDLSNAFSVGLSSGAVSVAASAPTHVVIDIAGYVL